MTDFSFTELLPLGPDTTTYRKLDVEGVSTIEAAGRTFLTVEPQVLTTLASEAMHDIAHFLRTEVTTDPNGIKTTTTIVASPPVPDTHENRARYGGPNSGGKLKAEEPPVGK